MNLQIKRMTNIAAIAAIYVAVSLVLNVFAFGPIQVRISEVLIIAAIISVDGIYGGTIGCFFTNLIGNTLGFSALGIADVVGGTILTLLAAILAYYFRNKRSKNNNGDSYHKLFIVLFFISAKIRKNE